MSAYVDIEVRENVDWTMDPAPRVVDQNGAVVDISLFTAAMKVRAGSSAASTLLLALTDGAGLVMGGALGTITPSATRAQLAALSPGNYYYDLLVFDVNSRSYEVLDGRFRVLATRTQ